MTRLASCVVYWLGYWFVVCSAHLWMSWLRVRGHSKKEARDILCQSYAERRAREWAARYLQGEPDGTA